MRGNVTTPLEGILKKYGNNCRLLHSQWYMKELLKVIHLKIQICNICFLTQRRLEQLSDLHACVLEGNQKDFRNTQLVKFMVQFLQSDDTRS